MLGKLFKYEMKATARNIIPLYILIMVFSLLNNFLIFNNMAKEFEWIKVVSIAMLVILCIALFVIMLIIFIQRFYKNLFKDEGYLTFTLPVTSHEIILSKLLSVVVWGVATIIVAIISIFLFTVGHGLYGSFIDAIKIAWNTVITELPPEMINKTILMFIIELPVSSVHGILCMYFCITFGSTMFPKSPVAMSVATYIALSFIINIINTIAIIVIGMAEFNPLNILIYDICISTVLIATYYTSIILLLKNKLNLQ